MLIVACSALQIFNSDFQPLALDDVPPSILTKEAREGGRQKVVKSGLCQFDSDQPLFLIKLSFLSSIFGQSPLLASSFLEDEGVADMVVVVEADGAQSVVLADCTLVHVAALLNLL